MGRKTTRTVDAAGRVTAVKDAAGNEVAYTLDQAGNATAMERKDVPAVGAPETFRTEFVFDALNRRTTKREIDRLNASNILTTTFEFDSRSNLTFRVDAENNPVRWTYDLASRITDYERALAVGAQIDVFTDAIHETMQYDKVHRLTTVTDDNFNATTYAFDALGRPEKTTFADGKFVTRTFDKNSNVSGWTDQNGSVISHVFDANDRLVQRDIVRGTGVLGPTQELYTYDALNRLTLASDDDYQFSRVFDSVGNLLSESQGYTATGQEKWKTVSTGWNSVGASINVTYPSGRKFTHNRDAIDRLLSIVETIPNVAVTTHTWQGVGRKATATHQNGTMTEYAWDGFARIQAIDHQTPTAQTFHNFEYAYDKAHNRRMEQNSFNATWLATLPTAVQTFLGARNGKGDVYAYDRAYRMVDARYDVTNPQAEVSTPGSQTYVQLIGYTLDGLGNRSQVQTTLWGGAPATTTYASDVVNQYTAVGGVSGARSPRPPDPPVGGAGPAPIGEALFLETSAETNAGRHSEPRHPDRHDLPGEVRARTAEEPPRQGGPLSACRGSLSNTLCPPRPPNRAPSTRETPNCPHVRTDRSKAPFLHVMCPHMRTIFCHFVRFRPAILSDR